MTLEIAVLFTLLSVMAYFFFTEKLPIELTAFAGLLVLVLGGFVGVDEAFTGFSSPVVITMLSIFFLSAALLHTGVADMIGARAQNLFGNREVTQIVAIMLISGALSAFMNNIAAAAVLLPAVGSIARRTGIAPSLLFMPLAFGSILGGTTTLVGTPPNMIAAAELHNRGLEPFSLFEFSPIGILFLGVGTVYMATIGRKILPRRAPAATDPQSSDLVKLYKLQERFFSIRIPDESKLDGLTLRDSRVGSALGVQVLSIRRRDGKKLLAPGPDTRVMGGDELLLHGRPENVERLFRVQGVELLEADPARIARTASHLTALVARLRENSRLIGRSPRELRFRETFGLLVVGIVRDGTGLSRELRDEPLRAGDEIVTLAEEDGFDQERLTEDFELEQLGRATMKALRGHLFELRIPEGSDLAGRTIGESGMGELVGVTVSGILRGDEKFIAADPMRTIEENDRLVVLGEPDRVRALLAVGKVELHRAVGDANLESDTVGIVEATLSPRSRCASQTLAEMRFRERHGLQAIAVWREGEPIHTGLAKLKLRFGDALLLQGPWNKIRELGSSPDFVVMSLRAQQERRTHKAPFAIGALLLMIAFVVTGYQPIHVAAFAAAVAVLLARTISMEEAYRAVEWRAIFLVAAILPVGVAMERTGAAALVSDLVTSVAAPAGPIAVLIAMALLASALSQCLDGAPAVVILTPVVLDTAEQLEISPYPLMMAIAVAASAAFMTPFSHKANLLVMGAGGYRPSDYLRVGTPLTILLLLLLAGLAPIFFPL